MRIDLKSLFVGVILGAFVVYGAAVKSVAEHYIKSKKKESK